MPPPETPRHSWASLGQSLVGSLPLAPGSSCTQGILCALQESVSPVLCKFWQLHGGVNGDLLQEGLCHTQVCCIQSPCLCGGPLLTRTNTGVTPTQSVSVSVGCLGSGAHKVCLTGIGFDSKCEFSPPTVLLGPFLCPWAWGISS